MSEFEDQQSNKSKLSAAATPFVPSFGSNIDAQNKPAAIAGNNSGGASSPKDYVDGEGDCREDMNHGDHGNLGPDNEDGAEDEECACCNGSPYRCQDPTCSKRGMCGCVFDQLPPSELDTSGGAAGHPDEWFPSSRGCTCCDGKIYSCKQLHSVCKSEKVCCCHFGLDVGGENKA